MKEEVGDAIVDIFDRVRRAWSAFKKGGLRASRYSGGSYRRPDKIHRIIQNERSIVNSMYNKIAVHCASIDIRHVRTGENSQYKETIDDSLNRLFSRSANIDQTGRAFVLDCVLSMFDEGCIALVPTDTTEDPETTDSYEVLQARVGRIIEWFPQQVLVDVYNENTGLRENILLQKRYTPIIENPFYCTMNEPSSVLQRLLRTYSLLDQANEKVSSNKLDLIIQLPYAVRSDIRQKQAEDRISSIETQLAGSSLGITYIDASERVIQLNRAVENNLWNQAKELKSDLYVEMGVSPTVFDGTADDKTMLNYYNQIVEPILSAIVEEIERKWISKTAKAQGQAIRFFRNPFKLVPVAQIAEIADKFTRNEILTSNEIRAIIGMQPSDDPRADELRNSNLNQEKSDITQTSKEGNVLDEVINIA